MVMSRVLLRLYLSSDRPLGPGKIKILETIRDGGSISGAAREMRMSYRSAWLLVDSMNSQFKQPVVSTVLGGRGGGSATLTPFGATLIERYRSMERATRRAIAKDLAALERQLRKRT
jgi:molybdate transport system regulatory protein